MDRDTQTISGFFKVDTKIGLDHNQTPMMSEVYFENDCTFDHIQECIKEMRCFVKGDVPGIARLKQVFKNIFRYYDIASSDDMLHIIKSLGLSQRMQNGLLDQVGLVPKTLEHHATTTLSKKRKLASGDEEEEEMGSSD